MDERLSQDTEVTMAPTPSGPPSPGEPPASKPRLQRRQSRFTEDIMTDGTPAATASETTLNLWYGPSKENISSNNRSMTDLSANDKSIISKLKGNQNWLNRLRLLHSGIHMLLISVVLAFYGCAIHTAQLNGRNSLGRVSIVVTCVLAVEFLLDASVLAIPKQSWTRGAHIRYMLRVICSMAYFCIFLVYESLGHVLPDGDTYWGMSPREAKIFVYTFVWVEFYWSLLHTIMGTLLRRRQNVRIMVFTPEGHEYIREPSRCPVIRTWQRLVYWGRGKSSEFKLACQQYAREQSRPSLQHQPSSLPQKQQSQEHVQHQDQPRRSQIRNTISRYDHPSDLTLWEEPEEDTGSRRGTAKDDSEKIAQPSRFEAVDEESIKEEATEKWKEAADGIDNVNRLGPALRPADIRQ